MRLRLATRKSRLALVQTRWVSERLAALEPGIAIEIVEMVTQGDSLQGVRLADHGGKGLFVSELENAILDGRADVAVHSMKDLPAELAPGLVIAAVPEREDPRDVLLTREGMELDDLVAGSRVGTASPRREGQLRRVRNDLAFELLRGNVETRLRRLDEGDYDAIVLAYAGLRRLGLDRRPLWAIPPTLCLPAVGQGALAIEARAADEATVELCGRIEHAPSRARNEAERAFLHALGGDCHTPLAAHARFDDELTRLSLDAWVGSTTGEQHVRGGAERYLERGDDVVELARALGAELGRMLLDEGAGALLA
jgi:hydroxymethylbilane synthase